MANKEMISSIYAIQCNTNCKTYIGVSDNLPRRISGHLSLLTKNTHSNKLLQNDFNKFGITEFSFYEIKSDIQKKDCWVVEQEYMEKFNTRDPKYGYNLKHKRASIEFTIVKGEPKRNVELAELIQTNGFTQSSFARKIGTSPQVVGSWFAGICDPGPDKVVKIAEALGIEIKDITF